MSTSVAGAVPVAVAVDPIRRERVLRLVEGGLGWPVVELDDSVLPPAALITDVATVARPVLGDDRRAGHRTRVPVVLLVDPRDEPRRAARAGAGAAAVLTWSPSVDELHRAVDGVTPRRGRRPWCVLGGAAGGVGATTVALAIAGIRAWRVGPTVAVVSGPPHVGSTPSVDGDDLTAPAVWSAATGVPGLGRLRVVSLRPGTADRLRAGRDGMVVDVGVVGQQVDDPPAPDVLVVRPDRAGAAAAETTPAGAVVVIGDGPVPSRRMVAAAGSRLVVAVALDARVARATHVGRHPSDAPGAWLRPLDAVVALLDRSGQ